MRTVNSWSQLPPSANAFVDAGLIDRMYRGEFIPCIVMGDRDKGAIRCEVAVQDHAGNKRMSFVYVRRLEFMRLRGEET